MCAMRMLLPPKSLTPSEYLPSALAALTSASNTSVKYPNSKFCPRTDSPRMRLRKRRTSPWSLVPPPVSISDATFSSDKPSASSPTCTPSEHTSALSSACSATTPDPGETVSM